MATVNSILGDYKQAATLYEKALSIKISAFGEVHSFVAITKDHMASNLLSGMKKNDKKNKEIIKKSSELYAKALEIFNTTIGDNHSSTAITKNNISVLLLRFKYPIISLTDEEINNAVEYLKQSLSILTDAYGPSHSLTIAVNQNLTYTNEFIARMKEKKAWNMNIKSMKILYHFLNIGSSSSSGSTRDKQDTTVKVPEEWQKNF